MVKNYIKDRPMFAMHVHYSLRIEILVVVAFFRATLTILLIQKVIANI
jgi:hypothetical protein